MQDNKYCYPNTNVLKNKFGLKNPQKLFDVEKRITMIRLHQLQDKPISGDFDFEHLKTIHKHIFEEIYSWAGQVRTVEIGKGNLFCTTAFINDYADTIFSKYYPQCYDAKNNKEEFVKVLAANYGDLNALHPFREGNGRAQREFARQICLDCGYAFSLNHTTHKEMLQASILSFNKGDNSLFVKIFDQAISSLNNNKIKSSDIPAILTSDDLLIGRPEGYDYYELKDLEQAKLYNDLYKAKIQKMDAEYQISETQSLLESHRRSHKMKMDKSLQDKQNKGFER